MSEPLLHQLPEAFQRIGIGRSKGYELIAQGELHAVRIGRRTLIAEDELQRYVQTLTGSYRNSGSRPTAVERPHRSRTPRTGSSSQ